MNHISKDFFGVNVLDDIDFKVRPGTVHALMGENGAGKSTLMKILAGIYSKQEGAEIILDGKAVDFKSPMDALHNGIAMIHQELTPIREMKISENIFLGREPMKGAFVDYKKMDKDAAEILKKLDCYIPPSTLMGRLKVADIQLCEIAKAVSYNSKIIVMDEPTSALTARETEDLFKVIRELKSQGKGIIYISHKMDEILQISDEITVLRDGKLIKTWKSNECSTDEIATAMVGREMDQVFPKRDNAIGDVIFEAKNLTTEGKFYDVGFDVRRGEVLGIVGLMGAGRTETMEAVFGIAPLEKGELILNGKKVNFKYPSDAIRNRVAFITEDRKRQGLVLTSSVLFNITLSSQDFFKTGGVFIDEKKEKAAAQDIYDKLRVKARTMTQPVRSLSGGNQQKVVLAKWLLREPDVLIMDEPTRGIDVGAKHEIYKLMNEMCAQGKAVIMVSSEMPEVLGMSDRVVVFSNRTVVGELEKKDFDQEEVLRMAMANL
ncbi:MAG: sugar ABC transporter ATP-binding protein [Christensenellaceae bacterium]